MVLYTIEGWQIVSYKALRPDPYHTRALMRGGKGKEKEAVQCICIIGEVQSKCNTAPPPLWIVQHDWHPHLSTGGLLLLWITILTNIHHYWGLETVHWQKESSAAQCAPALYAVSIELPTIGLIQEASLTDQIMMHLNTNRVDWISLDIVHISIIG